MKYDFDRVWEREGTHSVKWGAGNGTDSEQVLPMWVADMDFAVAPEIAEAISKRAAHPIFGYAKVDSSYHEAIVDWQRERNGWDVDPDWIVPVPGIVPAMHLMVRRFTQPGDGVLLQRPVYHPFSNSVRNNGREVHSASLTLDNGQYRMDFDALESIASDPRVRLALLCSPHNPVGRVWTAEELERFAEICARHNVLVFADEIHGDLILPGERFTAYGTLATPHPHIVGTASSKSFNLAGLKTANLIIADPEVRALMNAELRATGLGGVNPFGIAATQAAYQHGAEWLREALDYIAGNVARVRQFLADELGEVRLIEPEGTYLLWLDFSALELTPDELGTLLMDKARLHLNEGRVFGPEGNSFARLNVACPRSLVDEAMARLKRAIRG